MPLRTFREPVLLITVGLAAWTTATLQREAVRAAEPGAPALRHQFLNNVDARKQTPDAKGMISVTFKTPLPAAPTIFLQCANPRYWAKVHGASPTGFVFALYRTPQLLRLARNDPFNGEGAPKPVTDFRDRDNIDLAWVAIAE
jgi:hypothetical protein